MRPRSFLLILFGLASVVALMAAGTANARTEPVEASLFTSAAMGAVFGITALVSTWAIGSTANLVLRTLAYLMAVGCCGIFVMGLEMRLTLDAFTTISVARLQTCYGYLALTSLVMTLPAALQRVAPGIASRQTTIAQLLSLTTAVGLVLGGLQHARWPAIGALRLAMLCAAPAVPAWIAYLTAKTHRCLFTSAARYLASGAIMAAMLQLLEIPGGRIGSISAALCECLVLALGYAIVRTTHDRSPSRAAPSLRIMTVE